MRVRHIAIEVQNCTFIIVLYFLQNKLHRPIYQHKTVNVSVQQVLQIGYTDFLWNVLALSAMYRIYVLYSLQHMADV